MVKLTATTALAVSAVIASHSASASDDSLAALVALANQATANQLALAMYQQSLSSKPEDQCGVYLSLFYPDNCSLLNPDQCIKREWDGKFVENQQVGIMIKVTFEEVKPQFTTSYAFDDKFVVSFYGAPREINNYGKKYVYALVQTSEEGQPTAAFQGVAGGDIMDYDANLDRYSTLPLTALGAIADGATFSLSFNQSDKDEAIDLIKTVFANCSK